MEERSAVAETSKSAVAEVERCERLKSLLTEKVGSLLNSIEISIGHVVVRVKAQAISEFAQLLKLDADFRFNLLIDITVVDWLDARDERFEVVYHFLSLSSGFRLRVKASLPEENPEIASLVPLWSGANYLEREVWDMYGIRFTGHPDLRRILMYDEFQGHPLRKDYPVQGKQPRIALRAPEVRNTALDMKRQPLVQINRSNARVQGDAAPGDSGRFKSAKWE